MTPEYEPRPLPPFAMPEPPETPETIKRQAMIERAAHARTFLEARREQRHLEKQRRAAGWEPGPLSIDQVRELMAEALLPMHEIAVQVIKRQMREGPQSSRYRAVLDWRDTFLGKPNQARQEEPEDGDIVIVSSVMAKLKEAKDEAGAG